MSFHSWLQNLRSALALRGGQRHHSRPGSLRAATHRPNLEVLEDRFTPSLVWGSDFSVPYYTQALVTGDFNNDGHLDLATDNNDGTVSVLPGDGLGGFGVALQSVVGTGPPFVASMAVADLNSDGNLDVAVTNQNSAVLSVLLGNGDGTFRPPVNTATLPVPDAVAAADFNADGHTDLVVTSDGVSGGWGSAEVLLGDGQGGFVARHQYQVHTQSPWGLAVADLNADGRPDVVTVNISTTISVLLGNGDGTLRYDWSASNFAAGPDLGPTVAVGDFTGDGIPDVVATSMSDSGTSYAQQRVNVLPGRGDGTFAAQIQSFAGYISRGQFLTAADFNGDGKLDVFTVDLWSESSEQALLLGSGDGAFNYRDEYGFGGGIAVVGGDFNGDGRPDVAEADYGGVSVALNDGDWPPPPPPSLWIGDTAVNEGNTGTVAATFTVTLSAASTQTITVAYATGNGTATAGSDYQSASGTLTFAPGETSKTITVLVNGDRLPEPNETFFVNLSSPTNATIADGQGVATILDDEPRISISDVSKSEGKKNQTTLFTFTVTLSAAYDQPVTMSFQTVNGTATTSDQDYIGKSGTLTFAPGETTKTITIEVKGDSKKEANETFYLDLFGLSSNALFTKNRGVGTILNDD
jgi:hypothetical protein